MAEKNQVFSSKIKYNGIVSFKDFYKFCYDYLKEELEFDLAETKYGEKLNGDLKDIDIEWKGFKKIDDYFKHEIKVEFQIRQLKNVEIVQDTKKIKTNQGVIEVKLKGEIVRDYRSHYATNPTRKWMRSIYEKWVIQAKIEKVEEKLIMDCDEFLRQAKAYLDLEGKR